MWLGILQIPIYPKNFSPFLPSTVQASSRTGSSIALEKSPFGTEMNPSVFNVPRTRGAVQENHYGWAEKCKAWNDQMSEKERQASGPPLPSHGYTNGSKHWRCCHNLFHRGTITWTTNPDHLPVNCIGWHRVLEQMLGQLLHHGIIGLLVLFAKAHWRKVSPAVWSVPAPEGFGSWLVPSYSLHGYLALKTTKILQTISAVHRNLTKRNVG